MGRNNHHVVSQLAGKHLVPLLIDMSDYLPQGWMPQASQLTPAGSPLSEKMAPLCAGGKLALPSPILPSPLSSSLHMTGTQTHEVTNAHFLSRSTSFSLSLP